LLVELLPEPEAAGLLGLMLLHESRRIARTSPGASLILWPSRTAPVEPRADRRGHGAGGALARLARFGPYTLQAAIAAVHAEASSAAATDWPRSCLTTSWRGGSLRWSS